MIKFLRKYQKWLMVVFGALLMVAFTIQPALQKLGGDPAARVVAYLGEEKVRQRDISQASEDVQTITALFPQLVPNILGGEERNPHHWFLFVKEAELAGLIAGDGVADGRDWWDSQLYREFGAELYRQLPPEEQMKLLMDRALEQQFLENLRVSVPRTVAAKNRAHEDTVYATLGRLRGVMRLLSSVNDAARLSDRRAADEARYIGDTAWVDFAFIPGGVLEAPPEPTADEIAAHYERFKDVPAGGGEFGIGYTLPPRVKLEWITLERAAIRDSISIDPVEARKRFLTEKRASPARFPGEFDAHRDVIDSMMREELVARVLDEAHIVVQAAVTLAEQRLERDGQYRRLPADWSERRPRFEEIADEIVQAARSRVGVTIDRPQVMVRDRSWIPLNEIPSMGPIAQSVTRQGGMAIPFPALIASARELIDDPASAPIPVQVGLPVRDVMLTHTTRGDHYYVTILDARRTSHPDSIDEIRERIVSDIQDLRRYEVLAARLDEFRQTVVDSGLSALADTFAPPEDAPSDAPTVRVREGVRVSRLGAVSPELNSEAVRKRVFEIADTLDPLAPALPGPTESNVAALPVPAMRGVVAVVVRAIQPLSIEGFRLADTDLINRARQREFRRVLDAIGSGEPEIFSYKALSQRLGYTLRGSETGEGAEAEGARSGGGTP